MLRQLKPNSPEPAASVRPIAHTSQLVDVSQMRDDEQRVRTSGIGWWLLLYVIAYCVGAALDLSSTIAATSYGIGEGNTYTLSNGAYVASRALAINVAGGLIMLVLWGVGIARAASVSICWLDHPFASWQKFYFNPFASAVADRAPLHLVAWAVGFVVFRLLAAVNNAMLMVGLAGPIGWTIFALAPAIGKTAAFMLVVAIWYLCLTILSTPLAAVILRRRRAELERASA